MSVAPACRRTRRRASNIPPRNFREHRGFALVTVIWGLGLLTLFGAAIIVGARYRARAAQSDGSVLSTAIAAESAVNFAIANILLPTPTTSFPKICRMPGGERAEIVVEEEAGKIDINAAGLPTLDRLFAGVSRDKALGTRIAQNIVNFRKSLQHRERNQGASSSNQTSTANSQTDVKSLGFSTILELDQIDGMSPALLHSAMRYTTTLSGRTDPLPEAMTPALRQLMGLEPAQTDVRRPALPANLTIRVDIRARDGSRYIREALVSFGAASAQPYAIREWRRGEIASDGTNRLADGSAIQACIRLPS